MPFIIIRSDITKVTADAIVNTANPKPVIGSGTDSAIFREAGEEQLLAARKKIGEIVPGDAKATPAFALNASYIIHTVGPAWEDGEHGERNILRACYDNSLFLASELRCESIAFPLIATGVYGFPKDEALQIALDAIGNYLLTHEMNVILVVFDRESFVLSQSITEEIASLIDEHTVASKSEEEYSGFKGRRPEKLPTLNRVEGFTLSLDTLLGEKEMTFQEKLLALIDDSGQTDVTVYKSANIDRKLFSAIRKNRNYHPKKTTVLAFAAALKLDLDGTRDLLARAGYALSPSSPFDLILTYCITHGIYNIYEINAILFDHDQPTLGG